eukprot:SAG31_NODE_1267_length_9068_cov_26.326346_6_plen_141_part_00
MSPGCCRSRYVKEQQKLKKKDIKNKAAGETATNRTGKTHRQRNRSANDTPQSAAAANKEEADNKKRQLAAEAAKAKAAEVAAAELAAAELAAAELAENTSANYRKYIGRPKKLKKKRRKEEAEKQLAAEAAKAKAADSTY